jgi:hypothetical protein
MKASGQTLFYHDRRGFLDTPIQFDAEAVSVINQHVALAVVGRARRIKAKPRTQKFHFARAWGALTKPVPKRKRSSCTGFRSSGADVAPASASVASQALGGRLNVSGHFKACKLKSCARFRQQLQPARSAWQAARPYALVAND